MPLTVEALTEESNTVEIRDAIDKSYEECMREGGRTMKECGGMIYSIAREKTGKPLRPPAA